MIIKSKPVISLGLAVAVLAGCSSSSDNPQSMDPPSTDPDITIPPNSSGPFFNDESGTDFVGSLGNSLSRLFSSALASLPGPTSVNGASFQAYTARLAETDQQNCSSGTATVTTTTDDTSGVVTALSIVLDMCVEGNQTSNGTMNVLITSGNLANGAIQVSFIDFSSTDGTETSSINGDVAMSFTTSGDITTATMSGTSLTLAEPAETITFSDYSLTSTDNESTGAMTIQSSMTMTSNLNGVVTMNVAPPLGIPDDNTDYPTTGTMSMMHSDGSAISLTADDGDNDDSTFSYTLTNSKGETNTNVGNWDDFDLELPDV